MKRKKRTSAPAPPPTEPPAPQVDQCAQLLASPLENPVESPGLFLGNDSRSVLGLRVIAPRPLVPGDLAIDELPRAWLSSYSAKFLVKPRDGFPCDCIEEARIFGAAVKAHFRVTAELRNAGGVSLARLRPHMFAARGASPGVHVVFAHMAAEQAAVASHVALFDMSFAGWPLHDPNCGPIPMVASHARADKGLVWAAAACGDVVRLAHLLSLGASTEEFDRHCPACLDAGGTPVTAAARNGHLAAVRMIVEAGANITARKKRGIDLYLWEFNIPLLEAAKNGHVDVVSFLISLPRMDVNARYYMNGDSALHVAAQHGHLGVVDALLAAEGIDVEALSWYKATPLHDAVSRGHLDVVTRLLSDPRIDLNIGEGPTSPAYNTVLHRAVGVGHDNAAVLRLLLADPRVHVNAQDKEGRVALHDAAGLHGVPWNESSSVAASILLEDPRVNPNVQDRNGLTPLHLAAMYGRDSLISVLLSDPRIDPGARSLRQCTPLHEAARQGHVSAVRLLTADARVDVNALGQDFREDNVSRTSLEMARSHWNPQVVALLEADPRVTK